MDQKLMNLYRKVGIIYRLTQNYLNDQLIKEDLSFNEYIILTNIQPLGTYQEDIIKMIVVDKARIARLLKNLETKNYIIRQQDTINKRAKRIFITEKGHQKLCHCLNILSDWHLSISSQFDEHVLDIANEVIDGLYYNATQYHIKKKERGHN